MDNADKVALCFLIGGVLFFAAPVGGLVIASIVMAIQGCH